MHSSLGLYIANGRMIGEPLGRLPQRATLGSSVVDYAITDTGPKSINVFAILHINPLNQTTAKIR